MRAGSVARGRSEISSERVGTHSASAPAANATESPRSDQATRLLVTDLLTGRSQSETCAGCIVSSTTARSSVPSASRSISSRRRAEKVSSVRWAS